MLTYTALLFKVSFLSSLRMYPGNKYQEDLKRLLIFKCIAGRGIFKYHPLLLMLILSYFPRTILQSYTLKKPSHKKRDSLVQNCLTLILCPILYVNWENPSMDWNVVLNMTLYFKGSQEHRNVYELKIIDSFKYPWVHMPHVTGHCSNLASQVKSSLHRSIRTSGQNWVEYLWSEGWTLAFRYKIRVCVSSSMSAECQEEDPQPPPASSGCKRRSQKRKFLSVISLRAWMVLRTMSLWTLNTPFFFLIFFSQYTLNQRDPRIDQHKADLQSPRRKFLKNLAGSSRRRSKEKCEPQRSSLGSGRA